MAQMRIENWAVEAAADDPYKAPELRCYVVTGSVYGHPRFVEGFPIQTSRIVNLDLPSRILTTLNSTYQLGEPHSDYAAQFPQAKVSSNA